MMEKKPRYDAAILFHIYWEKQLCIFLQFIFFYYQKLENILILHPQKLSTYLYYLHRNLLRIVVLLLFEFQ